PPPFPTRRSSDLSRRGRQVLDGHLPQGAVHRAHPGVPGELAALGQQRLLEQFLDPVERAAEMMPLQQLTTPTPHPAREFVESRLVTATGTQELPHRLLRRVPG